LVAPGEAEVVVVVDQFEEAFTLTTDERERELFLESLRVAAADPESRLRVIVTLRADFYDRPLVYPRFGELLAEGTEAVPPLTPDELERAIRGPAQRIGVRPEPGLVAEMIADVAHQPGALPLLQYALTELFEHRDDDRLTLAAYREIGGIAGALSARADRIYESTEPHGRRATKQLFLRLVALGEGRQDTRRRVPLAELDALDVDHEAIESAVNTFAGHRLLTFDREPSTREPTVEIAHEALLGAWERLRTWIDDAREDLRQERGLARAAAEWRGSGGDPSFLLRGARLEQLESWAATTDLAVGRPERAYLKASVDQHDREQEEEERRREREVRIERRSARRLRVLVAVFAAAALLAGTLTVVATKLTVVATKQRSRAEREAGIATARELAAGALANLEADPELSILLATEAVGATRSADNTVLREAEEALHRAVVASRRDLEVPGVGGLLAWSPKGVFVTEGREGSGLIDIRDSETGASIRSFQGHEGDVNDVAFSPDGSMLASTGEDGKLNVWNASTARLISSVAAAGGAWGPSFSADGSLVAAAWGDDVKPADDVRVLDLSTDRVVSTIHVSEAIDTALSPDGKRVAVAWSFPAVQAGAVFDVSTGEKAFALAGPNCCERPVSRGVSWSPDGRLVAVSSENTARVWNAKTETVRYTLVGHSGSILSVAWSADSSRLVTGSSDGTAKVWEIGPDGVRERWSLSAQETKSGIVGVAFSPDGTRVMAGDARISAVQIWDLGPAGDAEWANLPAPGAPGGAAAEFMPDGRRVVTSSSEGRAERVVYGRAVTIWDLQTGRELRTLGPARDYFRFTSYDVSPDGSSVALGGRSTPTDFGGASAVRAWATSTGDERWRVGQFADINEVAFSPDGEHLATADWQGITKIVDRSGRVVRVLGGPGPYADFNSSDVAFSSDGRLVATAEFSNLGRERVRVWDWARRDVVLTIEAKGPSPQVEFDPTNPRLVLSGPAGLAEVWDVDSGERLAVLPGPPGGVEDLAFSPDGSRIATAGVDGEVRLFDADTGAPQLSLRGAGCAVGGVAFSPDGAKLASTSWCEGVRIWALDIDDLLEIARREAGRSLTDEECRQYLHVDECSQA
ncbi:MAG TPA: WD40 repeat domain-containing protein, partial [Actinomycetota bacterium]|nr:WD40 repeat domain-containing protein [Actinomycetota bacterium]